MAKDAIVSPCRRECQLHPIEKVCLGCLRSIDEIQRWTRLAPATRARIIDELPARRAAREAAEAALRARPRR